MTAYGRKLFQDAENYDATELERDLEEFSTLVEKLDNVAKV